MPASAENPLGAKSFDTLTGTPSEVQRGPYLLAGKQGYRSDVYARE